MVVCICNPTSNRDILNVISSHSSFKDLITSLNICTTCGICAAEVKSLWDEYHSSCQV